MKHVPTADQSSVHFPDAEFGRVQARDMLQHLWTGPISNAAVDVVPGSKSVEVRPVGVSKVMPFISTVTHCLDGCNL